MITDPVGSLPVVVGLTEHLSVRHRMRAVRVAVFTIMITLLIFICLGTYVLTVFVIVSGLTAPADLRILSASF